MKRYVEVVTVKRYYILSERYSIDDIFNKVIDANDHNLLKLIDCRNEVIYIRASMIESIGVTTNITDY